MSLVTNLATRVSSLQTQISRNQAELQAAQSSGNPNRLVIDALQTEIARQQEELLQLRLQLQQAQREDALGTASSGQVINEEARAKAEKAASSNPVTPATNITPVNQAGPVQPEETGTNGRLRPLVETQATPPASAVNPSSEDQGSPRPGPATQNAGVGAPSEDGVRPNTNQAQALVNATFNQPIRPQNNVLVQYASYNYALSWYLLTPRQYATLMGTGNRSTASWQLLMQSGGAPTQVADPTNGGRNQYFSLDFYMDNLEIDTLCTLKGTGTAHSATALRFNVTEPTGLTLISNLFQAVQNLYSAQTDGSVPPNFNYAMAMYCMVIRFYGYDDSGNLVNVGRRGTDGTNNPSDPLAVVEKYYPFIVTNITFKNTNRAIEYRVEGVPQGYNYGFGVNRGTIPYNFELSGKTVKDILRGTSTVAPPADTNRPTTVQPATTLVQGPPDPGYPVDPSGIGLF